MAPLSEQPALVFIGFMGAGKSVTAAAVAAALGEPWADSDDEFERVHGPIKDAFASHRGEPAFREGEEQVILELLERGPRVLALGGGAVETPAVREALAGHVVVWCQVGYEEARRRIGADPPERRPPAADEAELRRRFDRRAPIYEQLATAILPEGDRDLGARAALALDALRGLPATRMAWARSPSGEYPCFVGRDLLGSGFWPLEGRRFLVTDSVVGGLYGDTIAAPSGVVEIAPGERAKTLAEAERVLRELTRQGMTRADHVAALGGGVVGDLAGFCAAVYQRGVEVVQVPTTLVAQVDSAYGGKTGVDLPEAKNYVGAYHLPAAVLTDPSVLRTLPRDELAAGFVEVLKTALIAGGGLWERVRDLASLDPEDLGDLIFAGVRTKLAVVAADERDQGRRAALNLGHTVGHAIEQATAYGRYRHGEAVGLGLLAALRLSDADELRDEVAAILERHGLPTTLDPEIGVDEVLAAVGRDKKRTADGVGFVLCDRPGEIRTGQVAEVDRVHDAVEELSKQRGR